MSKKRRKIVASFRATNSVIIIKTSAKSLKPPSSGKKNPTFFPVLLRSVWNSVTWVTWPRSITWYHNLSRDTTSDPSVAQLDPWTPTTSLSLLLPLMSHDITCYSRAWTAPWVLTQQPFARFATLGLSRIVVAGSFCVVMKSEMLGAESLFKQEYRLFLKSCVARD